MSATEDKKFTEEQIAVLEFNGKRMLDMESEYDQASKIVAQYKKYMENIKKVVKETGVTKYHFKDGDEQYLLSFKMVKSVRVSTTIMPEDIRQKYTTETVICRNNSTKF